jgi:hypothetical protein
MNSSDPFARFNRAIDGLLTQVSAPVAFAAMPLSVPRATELRKPIPSSSKTKLGALSARLSSRVRCRRCTEDKVEAPGIGESFFIVSPAAPSTSTTDQPAFLPKSRLASSTPPSSTSLASNKTMEELTMENAHLKQSLDSLSQRFSKLLGDQRRERETLKHSILSLKTDIRKESDRVVRVPLGSTTLEPVAEKRATVDEVEELRQELKAAKMNAAKCKLF